MIDAKPGGRVRRGNRTRKRADTAGPDSAANDELADEALGGLAMAGSAVGCCGFGRYRLRTRPGGSSGLDASAASSARPGTSA